MNNRILILACFGLLFCASAGRVFAKDTPSNESLAGQKIYVAKCAKCHKFYDPAKYSDADWQVWMAKMSKKAKLKPEQQEEVSRYIMEKLRAPNAANSRNVKTSKR